MFHGTFYRNHGISLPPSLIERGEGNEMKPSMKPSPDMEAVRKVPETLSMSSGLLVDQWPPGLFEQVTNLLAEILVAEYEYLATVTTLRGPLRNRAKSSTTQDRRRSSQKDKGPLPPDDRPGEGKDSRVVYPSFVKGGAVQREGERTS